MDVLCVDKTGTITMNQLAVTEVVPQEHSTEADVLFSGAGASQEADQDPIDLAFLSAALTVTALAGTVLAFLGLPGLRPLPWWQALFIFIYAMVSCLILNDAVKVVMIRWRVPTAVAGSPV